MAGTKRLYVYDADKDRTGTVDVPEADFDRKRSELDQRFWVSDQSAEHARSLGTEGGDDAAARPAPVAPASAPDIAFPASFGYTPPAPQEPPAPVPEPSMWESALSLMRPRAARASEPTPRQHPAASGYSRPAAPSAPVSQMTALGRGARDPVGAADELAGIGAAVASVGDRTRDFNPRGAYESGRAAEQELQAVAAEQHPFTHGTGRAFTTAAATAPLFVAAPASGVARTALGAAEGGALGAATGAASAEPGERTRGAARGGAFGMAAGAALPAMAAGARSAAPRMDRFASEMRGAATGMYGAQVDRLAKQKGREYLAEMGRTLERRGVDRRPGVFGLGKGVPMGAGAYARNLEQAVPKVGAELDAVLTQAEAAGADAPTAWVRNRLTKQAQQLEQSTTDSALDQAAQLRTLANRLPDPKKKPRMRPRELQALKEDWTGEVWNQANPQLPRGGTKAEAYRAAAGVPRELLDEMIERKASPELAAKFKGLRDEYGHLRTAQDFAEGREAREVGNHLLSLPTTVAGAGGLALDPTGGASIATMAAQAAIKNYGKDALADVARGGQRIAEAVGRVPTASGAQAAAFGARVPATETPWGALAGRSPAAAQDSQPTDSTHGYDLVRVARDAVKTDRARLGDYASRFDAVAGSDAQTAALLERLTKDDERFRRMVLPALQRQATAQAAGR